MTTIIIGIMVAGILFLAGRQLYKDKKTGKSLCGGQCESCPNGCACHTEVKK